MAKLANNFRVVLQDVADSIERFAGRRVKLGFGDEMRRDIEGRSHNGRYIKSALEALPVSRADMNVTPVNYAKPLVRKASERRCALRSARSGIAQWV